MGVQPGDERVLADSNPKPMAATGQDKVAFAPARLIASFGSGLIKSWSNSACVYWSIKLVWVLNRKRSIVTPPSRYPIVKLSGVPSMFVVTSYLKRPCGSPAVPDTKD